MLRCHLVSKCNWALLNKIAIFIWILFHTAQWHNQHSDWCKLYAPFKLYLIQFHLQSHRAAVTVWRSLSRRVFLVNSSTLNTVFETNSPEEEHEGLLIITWLQPICSDLEFLNDVLLSLKFVSLKGQTCLSLGLIITLSEESSSSGPFSSGQGRRRLFPSIYQARALLSLPQNTCELKCRDMSIILKTTFVLGPNRDIRSWKRTVDLQEELKTAINDVHNNQVQIPLENTYNEFSACHWE